MRCGGGTGRQVEFAEDIGDVTVNRVLAHPQVAGNAPVGQAVGEQAQNLFLARRQR